MRPGTTRSARERAFPDLAVEESTIGTEWGAGELSGTLSGEGEDGTVEAVWSGATCIAR